MGNSATIKTEIFHLLNTWDFNREMHYTVHSHLYYFFFTHLKKTAPLCCGSIYCNPSTWKVEAGESMVQSQSGIHSIARLCQREGKRRERRRKIVSEPNSKEASSHLCQPPPNQQLRVPELLRTASINKAHLEKMCQHVLLQWYVSRCFTSHSFSSSMHGEKSSITK